MSRGIVNKITGTVSLLIFLFSEAYPQDTVAGPVRLMFYNVENLFDISNDPVTDDDEFTPVGLRRWNSRRYFTKINSIYKTIAAAGEWEPPAIVGFCEVENRRVIEDIVSGTNLSKNEYDILHEDSPDPRGIDVCLIYRKNLVKVLSHSYFLPADSGRIPFKTRSVLYAKCVIMNDTIHLFVNHWPSRRGGVLAGEPQRLKISEMLMEKADSIAIAEGMDAGIIFAGDFNAAPEDEIISKLTGNYRSGLSMINMSDLLPEGSGTYRYKGTWEMIDQVIISEALLAHNSASLKIFNSSFLLHDDPIYPGQCPYSTYRGYRYQGGYSDHLPVLLNLNVKRFF
ncbi:MAG: endonuclease [Bacteroidia bacterium]|nr:endonuclease [Bacteroidia bacterium]